MKNKTDARLIKNEKIILKINFPKKTDIEVEIRRSKRDVPFSSSLTKLRAIPVIEAKNITVQSIPVKTNSVTRWEGILKLRIVVEIKVKSRTIEPKYRVRSSNFRSLKATNKNPLNLSKIIEKP